MNILFVVTNVNGHYGGSERYVSVLSNALVEQGHQVAVICSGGPMAKHLDKKVIVESVGPIIDTPIDTPIQETNRLVSAIERVSKKHKIDLVHSNSLMDLKAASLVKKTSGIPVVHTAHSAEQTSINSLGAQFVGKADKVIAVSIFIKTYLRKTGLFSRLVNLIYHGVDTDKFRERELESNLKTSLGIKSTERVIMCVARLEPIKGINHIIEAIPKMLERGNNIRVVFVGEGSHKNEYKKLAKDLGVEKKVLFFGVTNKVEELLSIADVFCLSSNNEALSFAILEAMAEGKPVVATKVGGIPEVVVDKVTGLLISPGNTQDLANAINKLLEDKPLARKLSKNAKVRINENFRFDRMIGETVDTYEEVLEKEKVYA